MSTYSYCPRGGLDGVYVTESELDWFAKNKVKSKYGDEVIPLPRVDSREQLKKLKNCSEKHEQTENLIYWETDKGSHGWCCGVCGKVLQWG